MSTTTIDKLCILTSGRTGSTFIIDALQKSGRVYALSEILRPDYIPNHFDISHPDGFLNKRVSSRGGAPPTLCPRKEWGGAPPTPLHCLCSNSCQVPAPHSINIFLDIKKGV